VLFGGNAGLGDGLIERGLGLSKLRLFLRELLLGAAGIEFDETVAGFDGLSGGSHPGNAEIGNDGGINLGGAGSLEIAAASDDDKELAFPRRSHWKVGGGLSKPHAVHAGCRCGDSSQDHEENCPGPDFSGSRTHFASPDSTTIAAERSGMMRGS